ncbi:MAG: alpha/beta hydrolase [Bacteroidales bacterium]|nr:alpha/beta hydrolase [Bacteroidales bacterium]
MKNRFLFPIYAVLLWICTLPVCAGDSVLLAKGYTVRTLALKPDFDGNPGAVLISKSCPESSQKAVLYVHGYNDYFFQDQLADWYLAQGYNFYALELRRYGRSLLPGQVRYALRRITDYYEELDMATDTIRSGHHNTLMLLNGHSMGGLVTALYASDRAGAKTIDGLFLNSPFLELNAGWMTRNILSPVFTGLGGIFPKMKLPVSSSPYYGESLHKDYRGEWDYDLTLKLLRNKTRAGWLKAMRKAHRTVRKGLSVDCPVLVMHSDRSGSESRWNDLIPVTDVVLNVEDIAGLSPKIGKNVDVSTIPQAKHDIILSNPDVRTRAFNELEKWLINLQDL